MKCPYCQEEIQDGAVKCRWCKEFIKTEEATSPPLLPSSPSSPADRRPLASAECDRLITMACVVGGGVAFIPIPGTSVMLTGIELLLMGAMAAVWGCPLTGSIVSTVLASMAVRMGLTTALKLFAEFLTWIPLVGPVAKPVVAATTIKIVGGGMNSILQVFKGAEQEAEITAEEAKQKLEDAFGRIREHGPELKDGLMEGFKGNGTPLAETLNKIFGLNPASPSSPESVSQSARDQQGSENAHHTENPPGPNQE